MANTYKLISSNVLSSTASSVSFSSIPATFTDLVLRVSARDNASAVVTTLFLVGYNTDTTFTANSFTRLYTNAETAYSDRGTASGNISYMAGASATANIFSNSETYIMNYASAQNKTISNFSSAETNGTNTARVATFAATWGNSAAINTITITPFSGGNFASGSSFYLYGIKNS